MIAKGRPVANPRHWDADDALEDLYATHWRSLVRLAALLVQDTATAEEVVQDAFVSMHRRWRRLNDHDKALAYLRQAVINGARSTLRHRVVVLRHEQARRAAAGADGPDGAATRRDAVRRALAGLTPRQREVLVLRYYLDLSEAGIADALGISQGAVKSHASRAMAALRAAVGDWWEDGA